jgi:low temperature requirement protein LtrA
VTPGQGARHLRPRGEGIEQPITTVELFFDLVYVFAVTQLSHLILDDLTVAAVGRAALLLLIVWWAWIYTTWMANWFDPGSPAVRGVLAGVMLVSLLMAAALPGAFGEDGMLFAMSYVTLQVGPNVAASRPGGCARRRTASSFDISNNNDRKERHEDCGHRWQRADRLQRRPPARRAGT